jgi:DUF1009 family protein
MEWLTQNWQTLTAGAGAVIILARIVVKLTPTPADDTILAKIVDVLKSIGLKLD